MKSYSGVANSYYQTQVTTADKREIVLYLYDGAIRFMNQGLKGIEDGNIAERCTNLGRAMDILMELTCMLDFEQGGELAERLNSLYTFAIQQLLLANSGNSEGVKQVRHAITIVSTVREGWSQMLKASADATSTEESSTRHEVVG